MSFANATVSYFALNKLLVGRAHERRTARLLAEVVAARGKPYRAGSEASLGLRRGYLTSTRR